MNRTLFLGFLVIFSSFCWLFCSSSVIAADFVVLNDKILTDNVTGLSWQRIDDNTKRTWQDARGYCRNLSLAGHDDWRLPNHYELRTILLKGSTYPAIDQDAFPATKADIYWSGSELPYLDEKSFFVDFGKSTLGNDSVKTLEIMNWQNEYFSRCIRGKRKKVQKK